MAINSVSFLLFLAGALLLYYVAPKKLQYLVLLGASVAFYLICSMEAAVYLLLTVLSTYGFGLWLARLHRQEGQALGEEGADRKQIKKQFKHRRRRVLTVALVLSFLTLAVFKYLNRWMEDVGSLLSLVGLSLSFRPLKLILPLGISFYIFQTAGYLIDVYRGKAEAERHFLKYALFACYFPQMIQGPINSYRELHPQLTAQRRFDPEALRRGIQLMLWGLLKKVFLADPLAGAVEEIYGNYLSYPGAVVLLGSALYCLQLYCDFSGGVDMVRGVSQMFGIEMAENFRRPYLSKSVDEFWRRWHMSLGEWMKQYLFYPLALSAPMGRLSKKLRPMLPKRLGKLVAPCLSTLIVFLVVGIWQGPGWQNIAYGLWNGGLMTLAMVTEPGTTRLKERLHIREGNRMYNGFCIIRTLLLVIIGRFFSHGENLTHALKLLWRSVRCFGQGWGPGTLVSFGPDPMAWLRIGIAGAVLLTVSLIQERGIGIREALAKKHWMLQFVLLFAEILLLVICLYLNSDYTAIAFVYENV